MNLDDIKLVAHTKDRKYNKEGYVIDDGTTHSPDWIDEMLQYGMSVFEAVADESQKATLKAIGEWLEKHRAPSMTILNAFFVLPKQLEALKCGEEAKEE